MKALKWYELLFPSPLPNFVHGGDITSVILAAVC